MCAPNGTCTCATPCPDCQCRPFIVCGLCAIWIPSREDSTSSEDDMGICPRKEWPHNRTKASDGCRDGVWPTE